MRRHVWLLVTLILCACTPRALRPPEPSLTGNVKTFELGSDGAGTLKFAVAVPPETPVAGVEWTLWVNDHRLAAGLAARASNTEGMVEVDAPFVVHHLRWQDGPVWLRLRVAGAVLVGVAESPVQLRFQAEREVLASGHFDAHLRTE